MVTAIKYFSKDPNSFGRGAGVYYHRGHGIYSKYSRDRDKKKLSNGWKIDKIGLPKNTRHPHISDGKIWGK
jgi:hypothetical protein